MIAGDGADAVEHFRAAVFWRREHLQDFAAVDMESVQQTSGCNIPQLYAEVHASRQSVGWIVAKRVVVRVQQRRHFTTMTFGSKKDKKNIGLLCGIESVQRPLTADANVGWGRKSAC